MWRIAENNIQPTRQELSCDGVDISTNQRNWIDMLVRFSSVPTLPSATLLFRSGKNHDFLWGLYDGTSFPALIIILASSRANLQQMYKVSIIKSSSISKKNPQMKTVGKDRDLCEVRVSRGGIKFGGSPSVTSLYNLHPTLSPVYSGIHVQPRRRLLWRPDYVLSYILREGQGHDIE